MIDGAFAHLMIRANGEFQQNELKSLRAEGS